MLTKNEITALSLSPTKKDFVQIWSELLEVAGKLSERWDPTSTNESDPGIVILKALTGIADKLNYNIDKNILEAFMPTAAQEDSMRKLCDMLGYEMKYYRSAEVKVNIKYYNSDPSEEESKQMTEGLYIPKFTVITNSDQDISYFTLDTGDYYLISADKPVVLDIPCMEGQVVKCESVNDNNVITVNQISENNRFYLPETQIAENGIFIYNVNSDAATLTDGTKWTKVDNLNAQAHGARVFKFGYDSYESRPYVEFSDGYSELFNEGLFIYYTRTSGINGNISSRTLTQLELPSGLGWDNVSAESFNVENIFSATTGANSESIKQAYNNFKKTIGTFETLVTCRDYMNKVYSLIENGKPLVSNVLVTDIRNDLNRAVTICSCDDSGIFYKDTPLFIGNNKLGSATEVSSSSESFTEYSNYTQVGNVEYSEYEAVGTPAYTYTVNDATKPVYVEPTTLPSVEVQLGNGITRTTSWHLGSIDGIPLFADEYDSFIENYQAFNPSENGEVIDVDENGIDIGIWHIKQNNTFFKTKLPITKNMSTTIREQRTGTVREQRTETITNNSTKILQQLTEKEQAIDHFDIIFYPFKSYTQIKNNVTDIRTMYDASFTYNESTLSSIVNALDAESIKTISHNIKSPRVKDKSNPNSLGDIVSINNYLRLNASIATNAKVTVEEGNTIIDNIKVALANAFNMRELDFGDEIPFDSIVDVIEKADPRIRVVSLNEPALYTTFSVLTAKGATTPVVTEYAVASDWLDLDIANTLGRLTEIDDDGNEISTFNTKEAKQIYNKLAVRNVLAGRVPLFNYNNTFKASFSEGAYQVTKLLSSKPCDNLAEPTEDNPFTIWTVDDVVYTGQLKDNEILYTETSTPEAYKNNIITEDKNENSDTVNNYITDINASCKLLVNEDNVATNVTLAKGEFVKFRAPNFTTIKTYPAYVNYHLELANKALTSEARAAEAVSLFNTIDSDRASWSADNTDVRWQRVLDYFKALDLENGNTSYLKTFTIAQPVSAFTASDNTVSIQTGKLNTTIGVSVNNTPTETAEYTPESLMALSGCVKLVNPDFKARVEWTPADNETAPDYDVQLDLVLEDFKNPFITDVNVLAEVKAAIDNALATYRDKLPTQCSFTVYLDFECVPFEAKSLSVWEEYIRTCAQKLETEYAHQILDFKPIDENSSAILWRLFGEGYDPGKYVTVSTEKLLKFAKNYFGLLPTTYLKGIYLAKDLGADATPAVIKNNEEYQLRKNEHLYIEYTPSTITGDVDTQDTKTITEIYGEGTIIRPSGFESGLLDSTVLTTMGGTPYKTVSFATDTNGIVQKALHRFNANEQVEIRDFARVTLSKESFKGDAVVFVYKNFNNCPELEASDGARTYTLKDGEYIFYTDQNKSEFAYFSSGTQVTLSGSVKFPEFEIIELASIFDSGIQEIPWRRLALSGEDEIIFQEFQYIVLSADDTIKSMSLASAESDASDKDKKYLGENWIYCDNVEYLLSGDTESATLPAINLQNDRQGNGWEACSTLELSVTPGSAQTLRSTDKIETSLTLVRTSTTGGKVPTTENDIITAMPSTVDEVIKQPISFKTNLSCVACGSNINIKNVYGNSNNLKGFQLKVFSENAPAIVATEPGKVIPPIGSGISDIAVWPGEPLDTKDYLELWNVVNLEKIRVGTNGAADNALRLTVSPLPNTYGIFCIYVGYSRESEDIVPKTWIEVVPGTNTDDIVLLNASNTEAEFLDDGGKKLAKLYLNSGINCIRVNNTCKLFIKTSLESQGSLYFDDLRLVNSLPIKYIDANQNELTLYTQGLNIEQLGYLNADENSDSILSETAKRALQAAYVDKAIASINKIGQEADDVVFSGYSELKALQEKAKKLVETEKLIEADLIALNDMDAAKLADLLEIHKKIHEELESENALLEAINNNVKADELETNLINLLSSFSSTEASQQKILDDIAAVKAVALRNIENFSADQIIADCQALEANEEIADVYTDIREEAAQNIEKNYQEQLTALTSNIERVVNSESKNELLAILNELRTAETAEDQAKLISLINSLNDAISQDSINDLIVDMVEAAAAPDYVRLSYYAADLSTRIEYRGLSVVVSELATAANERNNQQLSNLVEELKTLIDNIGKNSTDTKTLRGAVNDLISAVKTKVDSGTDLDVVNKDITEKVNNIKNLFISEYKSKLTSIKDSIVVCLDSLKTKTSIVEAIESLNTSKQDQLGPILTNLTAIINSRTLYLDAISSAAVSTMLLGVSKEFVREAILTIWPEHMTARLSTELDTIEAAFVKTLASDIDNFSKDRSAFLKTLDSVSESLTEVLDIDYLTALFDQIEKLLSIDRQNADDTEMVEAVADFVQSSPELTAALTTLKTNKKTVSMLVTELAAAKSIAKKRKLQTNLKEELAKAISTDEQLFVVISSLLYPSIVKFESDKDSSDIFYKKLTKYITVFKKQILAKTLDDISVCTDIDYSRLAELSFADFVSELSMLVLPEKSLLPDEFIELLMRLSTAASTSIGIKADLAELTEQPLEILSSDELKTITVHDQAVIDILNSLIDEVELLDTKNTIESGYEDVFKILDLENQLLADIRSIDIDREFYYNAPVEDHLAIELNDSDKSLNTLMNPATNYDINNINNSFVISKLDIDYLDNGLKIARSSRLN